MKIYRVVCVDQYQQTTPETQWHTSREYCENYIATSRYSHCLHIETEEVIVDN